MELNPGDIIKTATKWTFGLHCQQTYVISVVASYFSVVCCVLLTRYFFCGCNQHELPTIFWGDDCGVCGFWTCSYEMEAVHKPIFTYIQTKN